MFCVYTQAYCVILVVQEVQGHQEGLEGLVIQHQGLPAERGTERDYS